MTRIRVELVPATYECGTHIAEAVRLTVLDGVLVVEGGGTLPLTVLTGQTYSLPTKLTITGS